MTDSLPDRSPSPLPQKSFAVEPVHLRLAGLCREAILNGDFTPGDKFPSERELADRYEVSRATANKVISTLIAEGLLDLQKGIGTRVKKRRTLFASLGGMESFTRHAKAQGLEPSTEVITFERMKGALLPELVREGLGSIPSRESVVYIERLRLADGVPMIMEFRWVRESLTKGLCQDDFMSSFYRILEEKFGLPMTGEEHTISAELLSREAAKLFQVKPPFPVLKVEGTGFVRGGEPLWYQRLLYRGDRYQLHNETRGPASSEIKLRLYQDKLSA